VSTAEVAAKGIIEIQAETTRIEVVDEFGSSVRDATVFVWHDGDELAMDPGMASVLGRTDDSGAIERPIPPDAVLLVATVDRASLPRRLEPGGLMRVSIAPAGRIGVSGSPNILVSVRMMSPFRTPLLPVALDGTSIGGLGLPAGKYRVDSADVNVHCDVQCVAGRISWVSRAMAKVLSLKIVDAETAAPLPPGIPCRIERSYQRAGLRLSGGVQVTSVTKSGTIEVPLGGPQIAGIDEAQYSLVFRGCDKVDIVGLPAEGSTVSVKRRMTSVRVAVTADEASSFDLGFDAGYGLLATDFRMFVRSGRGEAAAVAGPGPWKWSVQGIGFEVPASRMRSEPSRVDVDLAGFFGAVECSDAPPDAVLVSAAGCARGVGVGKSRTRWTILPPGRYSIIPEGLVSVGLGDCGMFVDVVSGRTTSVRWEAHAPTEGSIIYNQTALGKIYVVPLMPLEDRMRVILGLVTEVRDDGSYRFPQRLSTDMVGVCRLRHGEWEVLTTGRAHSVLVVRSPLDMSLDLRDAPALAGMLPATVSLFGADRTGRQLPMAIATRVVTRGQNESITITEVPECTSSMVVSGCGQTCVIDVVNGELKVRAK